MADSVNTAADGGAAEGSIPSITPASTDVSSVDNSNKDMIAGLNARLKQSMNVIKTLTASEVALKARVAECEQEIKKHEERETENAAIQKVKDVQLTHLQVTCDGLKEELRASEKAGQSEENLLEELVTKLEQVRALCVLRVI